MEGFATLDPEWMQLFAFKNPARLWAGLCIPASAQSSLACSLDSLYNLGSLFWSCLIPSMSFTRSLQTQLLLQWSGRWVKYQQRSSASSSIAFSSSASGDTTGFCKNMSQLNPGKTWKNWGQSTPVPVLKHSTNSLSTPAKHWEGAGRRGRGGGERQVWG